MENENENWQLVNGTADMDIEDIVRFDHMLIKLTVFIDLKMDFMLQMDLYS
jgi:hypothetical protein